ncbi:hypothetical protein MSj_00552 [Microcystis aeruginosa Sj]|uniref:Uncharacterized protein n=2 Tax=Microcystis aeruginosa TaxID=1126 RepID=A0A2Z6UF78_MICAE|nr:hypothetical protein MSj_00552 [Microcystis aeruginosa Sj]
MREPLYILWGEIAQITLVIRNGTNIMAGIEGLRIKNYRALKDITLGKLWNANSDLNRPNVFDLPINFSSFPLGLIEQY